MADAGPSEGFLSSYFSNPFKRKKKRTGDIDLPTEGRRDPRLGPRRRETPKFDSPEHSAEMRKGVSIFRKLMERGKK